MSKPVMSEDGDEYAPMIPLAQGLEDAKLEEAQYQREKHELRLVKPSIAQLDVHLEALLRDSLLEGK